MEAGLIPAGRFWEDVWDFPIASTEAVVLQN